MRSSRGRRVFRWISWILLAGVVVTCTITDHRLKTTNRPGFLPENTTWFCYSADWPTFWASMAKNDLWQQTRPQLVPAIRALELHAFRAAGVRPTPNRFRLYLGDSLLLASTPDAYGICVKPGLVVRSVLSLRRWATGVAHDSILQNGNVFVANRNGFLIASESKAFVEAALRGPAPLLSHEESSASCQLVVPGSVGAQPQLQMEIEPSAGLPIRGKLRTDPPDTDSDYALDAGPPVPAIAFVSSGSLKHLASSARALVNMLPERTPLDPIKPFMAAGAAVFMQNLTADNQTAPNVTDRPLSVMCTGFHTESIVPVPILGLRATRLPNETLHPLDPFFNNVDALPYEWNHASGSLTPWLGTAMTICLAQEQNLWFAASTEPLMSDLTATVAPATDSTDAHMIVTIDWNRAADAWRAIAGNLKSLEFSHQPNSAMASRRTVAWADAIRQLSATRVQGSFVSDGLQFHGMLSDKHQGSK